MRGGYGQRPPVGAPPYAAQGVGPQGPRAYSAGPQGYPVQGGYYAPRAGGPGGPMGGYGAPGGYGPGGYGPGHGHGRGRNSGMPNPMNMMTAPMNMFGGNNHR